MIDNKEFQEGVIHKIDKSHMRFKIDVDDDFCIDTIVARE